MKFNSPNKLVNYILETAYIKYIATGNKSKTFTAYIAEVIGIMQDTLRKKIAASKSFTADELNIIIEHFKIDFTSDMQTIKEFEFNPIGISENSFIDYFKTIVLQLKYIQSCKMNKIKLTSEDMPIFYYFEYTNLAAFKLYFYKHTLFPTKEVLDDTFVAKNKIEELKSIADIYNQISSEELWTPRTIDSTIFQFLYLYDTKKITDTGMISNILNEFSELIEIIFTNAENESKNQVDKNLIMYRSDITISNNHICFEAETMKAAFVNITTFNTIKVNHPAYITEIEKWMDCMFKSGVKISGEGNAYRTSLQDIYKEKLKLLRQYIVDKNYNAKAQLMGM